MDRTNTSEYRNLQFFLRKHQGIDGRGHHYRAAYKNALDLVKMLLEHFKDISWFPMPVVFLEGKDTVELCWYGDIYATSIEVDCNGTLEMFYSKTPENGPATEMYDEINMVQDELTEGWRDRILKAAADLYRLRTGADTIDEDGEVKCMAVQG